MYKKQFMRLENPFSFWHAFPDTERIYWCDTQHDRIIIGAKRLAALSSEQEIGRYPYVFYGRTFFDTTRPSHWNHMGNELIAFTYYYVVDGDESYCLYADTLPIIDDKASEFVHHDVYESSHDYEQWTSLFHTIQRAIHEGAVSKVVASREVEFTSSQGFHVESILHNLVTRNSGCFIFAYQKEGNTFLGASPEVLVEKKQSHVMSYALAGTCAREGCDDQRKEALLEDPKNVYEHSLVRDMIIHTMKGITSQVTVAPMDIMTLPNLYHLRTIIEAYDASTSIIDWCHALHPTPAMGGTPSDVALDMIKRYESHERGMYASPLGMIEGNGDGLCVVGIRSALIVDTHLYAYVGCGIVADSDCVEEYKESNSKLRTILESL